jgi:hypothetical protein
LQFVGGGPKYFIVPSHPSPAIAPEFFIGNSEINLIKSREREMAEMYCYREALPFAAMVTMECVNVGLNTLFKAATSAGMSYHVFVPYAYAVAALVLLPAPFVSHRLIPSFPLNYLVKYSNCNIYSWFLTENAWTSYLYHVALIFMQIKSASSTELLYTL